MIAGEMEVAGSWENSLQKGKVINLAFSWGGGMLIIVFDNQWLVLIHIDCLDLPKW
jgi:hypothetical protein